MPASHCTSLFLIPLSLIALHDPYELNYNNVAISILRSVELHTTRLSSKSLHQQRSWFCRPSFLAVQRRAGVINVDAKLRLNGTVENQTIQCSYTRHEKKTANCFNFSSRKGAYFKDALTSANREYNTNRSIYTLIKAVTSLASWCHTLSRISMLPLNTGNHTHHRTSQGWLAEMKNIPSMKRVK